MSFLCLSACFVWLNDLLEYVIVTLRYRGLPLLRNIFYDTEESKRGRGKSKVEKKSIVAQNSQEGRGRGAWGGDGLPGWQKTFQGSHNGSILARWLHGSWQCACLLSRADNTVLERWRTRQWWRWSEWAMVLSLPKSTTLPSPCCCWALMVVCAPGFKMVHLPAVEGLMSHMTTVICKLGSSS